MTLSSVLALSSCVLNQAVPIAILPSRTMANITIANSTRVKGAGMGAIKMIVSKLRPTTPAMSKASEYSWFSRLVRVF